MDKFLRNTYFLFFLLYSFVGSVFEGSGIITYFSIGIQVIIGLICFAKTLSMQKTFLYITWTLLFLMNTTWYFFSDFTNAYNIDVYKGIGLCALSFYPAFYFSQKKLLSNNFLIVFILIYTISSYSLYTTFFLEQATKETTNNFSYLFVSVLPFVFLFPNKRIVLSFTYMFFLTFLVIQGAKRGAIIITVFINLFWLIYLIFYQKVNIKELCMVSLSCIIAGLILKQFILNSDYLMRRYEITLLGNYSGRDEIYSKILSTWLNCNDSIFYLFGRGFAATYSIFGTAAHNDWLELLFNNGVLGVILYFTVILSVFKMIYEKKFSREKRYIIFAILFSWFLSSIFSMFYSSINKAPLIILLVYLSESSHQILISSKSNVK